MRENTNVAGGALGSALRPKAASWPLLWARRNRT